MLIINIILDCLQDVKIKNLDENMPKGFTGTNMLHDHGKASFLFVFVLCDFFFNF